MEAGAYDGEFLSNTLFMERYLKWSGILIEANQNIFHKLLRRQRKSFSLPICLSANPYPTKVLLIFAYLFKTFNSYIIRASYLKGTIQNVVGVRFGTRKRKNKE